MVGGASSAVSGWDELPRAPAAWLHIPYRNGMSQHSRLYRGR